MTPVFRWAVVVCAAAAALSGSAQGALGISGGVYEDRAALALRKGFAPIGDAGVKLYRDDGDGVPSAADAAIATTRTRRDGTYDFTVSAAGAYWVVVDSRTIGTGGAWPEQTFGPGGSLCGRPDGTSAAAWFEGSCFGGRSAASDDAGSPATAEHVALINVRQNTGGVDFAFSFDAVTNVADGERIQGSLRQFVTNANAMGGPNRMRFVPLSLPAEGRTTSFGVAPRWWSIVLGSPLPPLSDADTVLDGTAFNFLSPASIVNTYPGRVGEAATIKPDERAVPRLEHPELELKVTGDSGIVCEARCGLRALAIHGANQSIVVRADAQLEHVLVGAEADAQPGTSGTTGLLVERGTVKAQHLLVTLQTSTGVMVRSGARLEAAHLEVTRCGTPQSGAGIALLTDGSSIRTSTIATNGGAGIIIGAADGSRPGNGNTIDGCTISGNIAGVVLAPGSSRNAITRNDLMWNRLGGIVAAPYATAPPPRENRFSANRFDENGLRPIVLNHAVTDPNVLTSGAATCAPIAGSANAGVLPPRLTRIQVVDDGGVARVVIHGRACPGQVVEIYQSYVTSDVDDEQPDLPRVRGDKQPRESLTTQERTITLPSIGEFNFLGPVTTAPDGTFEARFPLPALARLPERAEDDGWGTRVYAREILPGAEPAQRAFSAIAIDDAGNTSEMSVRRRVD